MHYPPRQPQQGAAEFFMPGQLQPYAPLPPSYMPYGQPPLTGQDFIRRPGAEEAIAVYPNRKQIIMRTIFCTACLIFEALILSYSLFFLFTSGDISKSSDFASLLPISLTLSLALAALFGLGYLIWRMASQLLPSHGPTLLINCEGITVARMPGYRSFFISWAEVEALSTCSSIYRYFCIHPKNPKQFLARFNPVERFLRWSNTWLGAPPLIVPQVFLDRSADEILRQVYYRYTYELNYYHVQIRP